MAPRGKPPALAGFTATCVTSSVIGAGLAVAYAWVTGGRAPFTQLLLAAYVCNGVICLMKAVAWLLREGLDRAFHVRVPPQARGGWWVTRSTVSLTLRTVVLFVAGLPYVVAVAMVYRPKVVPDDDPGSQFRFDFEAVGFAATDGVPIRGYWVPAQGRRPPAARARRGGGRRRSSSATGSGPTR